MSLSRNHVPATQANPYSNVGDQVKPCDACVTMSNNRRFQSIHLTSWTFPVAKRSKNRATNTAMVVPQWQTLHSSPMTWQQKCQHLFKIYVSTKISVGVLHKNIVMVTFRLWPTGRAFLTGCGIFTNQMIHSRRNRARSARSLILMWLRCQMPFEIIQKPQVNR